MTLSPLLIQYLAGMASYFAFHWIFYPHFRTFRGFLAASIVAIGFGQGIVMLIYHVRGI